MSEASQVLKLVLVILFSRKIITKFKCGNTYLKVGNGYDSGGMLVGPAKVFDWPPWQLSNISNSQIYGSYYKCDHDNLPT